MYKRILWDEIEEILNDDIYDKCLEDDNYINTVVLEEIEHLKSQGIEIINHNTENNYIVIKETTNLINFKVFPTTNIHSCDYTGKLTNKQQLNLEINSSKVLNKKAEIIIKYLTNLGAADPVYHPKKKIVLFGCPICGKPRDKMHMWVNSFVSVTKSDNDCNNDGHRKEWEKWRKDLKKIWNNSKEKRELVFSMNIEYINNIIIKNFPAIIKHAENNILFVYDNKKKHFVEMIDNKEYSEIETLIYENFFNDNDEILTVKQVGDVKNYIKKSYNFPKKVFESSDLINLKNGILNIKTNEFIGNSSKYFFNYTVDINYNPDADSTKLDNFLKSVITMKDPINLTQKILGHIHYQGTKLQKGFIFKGTKVGRNGKGTFVKLLSKCIGTNRTINMNLNMLQESTFSTYGLKDKALYIEDDYKLDYIGSKITGFLNRLISQAPETVHQKNKAAIEIKHTAVPIIQCNKLPKLKAEDDGGFYKRFILVQFQNEFGNDNKVDEFLGDKLLNDNDVMSALLNYLVAGYKDLLYRKENSVKGSFFSENDSNFIDDWKKQNNSILQFIDETCELDKNTYCSTRELWKLYYSEWNLKGSKLSETKFIKQIKEELNLTTIRKRINGKFATLIKGIKYIDDFKENNLINMNC